MSALSSDQSALLGLPYLMPAQAQKHVTHNEALRLLDQVVQLAVLDRDLATPPGAPVLGARYLVAAGATGAWAGEAGKIAVWLEEGWSFLAPRAGWQVLVLDEGRVLYWTGSQWAGLENLAQLGINATPDAHNPLVVAGAATLLTHGAGGGHQVKINKDGPSSSGTMLFQSNWSGRAEMGLAGEDDFSFKVSANGATWITALKIDAATGALSGAGVAAGVLSGEAGQILRVGDFGLGGIAGLEAPENDADAALVTAFGFGFEAGAVGLPLADPEAGLMNVTRRAAQIVQDLADTETGARYHRASQDAGANFSPWAMLYDQATVLGDVSQEDGRPTGALLEVSATAEGRVLRLACGTQICHQTLISSASGASAWTFPKAFIAAPQISGVAEASVLAALCLDGAPTALGASLSLRDKLDARISAPVHLTAVGRWF